MKDKVIEGYVFHYIQELKPDKDKCELYPHKDYVKKDTHELYKDIGKGPFCHFKVETLEHRKGVYLWCVKDEIIYIGETVDMYKRFNSGYGNISPRNCYKGGQYTNCKMNRVVLDETKKGNKIKLYVCYADDHQEIEKELLERHKTKYNEKDNKLGG